MYIHALDCSQSGNPGELSCVLTESTIFSLSININNKYTILIWPHYSLTENVTPIKYACIDKTHQERVYGTNTMLL